MTAPSFTGADYTATLQALLPRGKVWPRDPTATITKVAAALAQVYARNNTRANQLLTEAFPATTGELLDEWESTLGLPGWYGSQAPTTLARQQRIVAALTDSGGQSAQFFISLLATLGWTATINAFTAYNVNCAVTVPIASDDWCFAWEVVTPGPRNYSLEAVVQRFAPAHTVPFFTYT
jgi:uncharacterized protein YmfQ (DUF2313 family)